MLIIRVNYDDLHDASQQLLALADELAFALRGLHAEREALEFDGYWLGQGAAVFYDEFDQITLPALQRLVTALNNASSIFVQPTIARWEDAETEAARNLLHMLSAFVTQGAQDSTAPPGSNAASAILSGDSASNLILKGKPYFKLAGDMLGLLPAEALLVALGIVPEPTVSKVLAGLGAVAMVSGPVLTYLENFDEEPQLARGMTVAVTDDLLGKAIDLTVAGAAVQWLNSFDQVQGTLDVAVGYLMADNLNLSDEMEKQLRASAERRYENLADSDLTNIRYQLSRTIVSAVGTSLNTLDSLGVETAGDVSEILGLTPEKNNLGENFKDLFGSVVDVVGATMTRPLVETDLTIMKGAAVAEHVVNESGLPDSLKQAFSANINGWTQQLQQESESLQDTIKRVLP
jgi:uncharacterized protein YukE